MGFLRKFLQSLGGAAAESVILVVLLAVFLEYRKKCPGGQGVLIGEAVVLTGLFCIWYQYFHRKLSVYNSGYMSNILAAAGAWVLSLLLVLLELAVTLQFL